MFVSTTVVSTRIRRPSTIPRSPPERHPPTTDLPPASRVPTDPRCLSPIPRATNSVARAVDGSLYRLRDEICLRYSSASSSTNATALTHKTHEFLHYFCDGK